MLKKIYNLINDVVKYALRGNFKQITPRIYESYNSQMLNFRDRKSLKNIKIINKKCHSGVFISKSLYNIESHILSLGLIKQSISSANNLNIIAVSDITRKNINIDILYIDNISKLEKKLPKARYYWVTSLELVSYLNLLQIPYNNIFLIEDQNISQVFFVSRFFLSVDVISFEIFYNSNYDYNPFANSNFLTLTLPESYNRYQSFQTVNEKIIKLQNIQLFYGLRHEISWVGCGLSYKFLLSKAKQFNYSHVIICEDDIEFSDDFNDNYQTVLRLLNTYEQQWEIFSGLMPRVDISKIKDVFRFKSKSYVSLQFMLGMVFNIYNRQSYELILKWNNSNLLREQNQIDQYIKQNINSVILPAKFIVKLKSNTSSTIWLDNNIETKYENSIANAEKTVQSYVEIAQQIRVIE